jgi:ParB family chromosome partitioning protein
MGLSLDRIKSDAQAARDIKEALEAGNAVIELDPALIDDSFIADRLLNGEDAKFEEFKDGIKRHGQKVPILVRPHPSDPSRYEIAYGRRRRRACAALGRKVRAVVSQLTDEELVIAQGKENNDRENPSFIERAMFAKAMEERQFDRSVIMAALSVHKTELSRLLHIAHGVPAELVMAIGPAPKAGRRRWVALTARMQKATDAPTVVERVTSEESFRQADSDRRFTLVYDALGTRWQPPAEEWKNARGEPVVRIERSSGETKLAIDDGLAPNFGAFLVARLQSLYEEFEAVAPRESVELRKRA